MTSDPENVSGHGEKRANEGCVSLPFDVLEAFPLGRDGWDVGGEHRLWILV